MDERAADAPEVKRDSTITELKRGVISRLDLMRFSHEKFAAQLQRMDESQTLRFATEFGAFDYSYHEIAVGLGYLRIAGEIK